MHKKYLYVSWPPQNCGVIYPATTNDVVVPPRVIDKRHISPSQAESSRLDASRPMGVHPKVGVCSSSGVATGPCIRHFRSRDHGNCRCTDHCSYAYATKHLSYMRTVYRITEIELNPAHPGWNYLLLPHVNLDTPAENIESALPSGICFSLTSFSGKGQLGGWIILLFRVSVHVLWDNSYAKCSKNKSENKKLSFLIMRRNCTFLESNIVCGVQT
jgi:hypothetical protein